MAAKERLTVTRTIRFSKTQLKRITVYCTKNKIDFSDFMRASALKCINDEN